MQHPIDFNFGQLFPNTEPSFKVPEGFRRIEFAQPICYQTKDTTLVLHEHDAMDAYLCTVEIDTEIELIITIKCIRNDLYWTYQRDKDIQFYPNLFPKEVHSIPEGHYRILYISEGEYTLSYPKGRYFTFFFVLKRKWFLRQDEKAYHYFGPITERMINESAEYRISALLQMDVPETEQMNYILNTLPQFGIEMDTTLYSHIAILFNLSHERKKNLNLPKSSQQDRVDAIRRSIIKYIKDGKTFTLEDIAKDFSIYPTYLRRLHQKYYKTTLSYFQKDEKLKEGMRLLRDEGKTPTEAANHLHYDLSNFSTDFLEKFGISPKDV